MMRRAAFACAALITGACGNVEDPGTGPLVDDGVDSAAAISAVAVSADFTMQRQTLTTDRAVTAMLARTRYTLEVTLLGTAGGDGVISSPAGIDCHDGGTGACVASFDGGTVVTLTPTPGLVFWEAPGCSSGRTCTVTMSADEIVLAHFD